MESLIYQTKYIKYLTNEEVMDFTSDNICGVSKEILAALSVANEAEAAAPYGADAMSMTLNDQFSYLFKRDAIVFPVVTGTAANALALSACVQPWQAILTHEKAHIEVMECGAPEFITGGAKLIGVAGDHGKISVEALEKSVRHSGQGCIHRSQIACISLTQTTDAGTVYSLEELKQITDFAKENGLLVHMDGARFANAVAALGCEASELVKGIDVLSFGATKNGAMNAEAIVFFNKDLADNFIFQAKRTGHVISKARFLAAQLQAYITDDLWLKNAKHANQSAQYLAQRLGTLESVYVETPVESNLVFVHLPADVAFWLQDQGVGFYSEEAEQKGYRRLRFVCGFSTPKQKIDDLVDLLASHKETAVAA
ncbi:beta-eliminating lyase-related protein [Terasakiella sp. A23]|uniref:threonine aldolase family protein n=1 Tax=Terasakiella sp. FCG-A23 TaxID=3080561 RepID=UPI002954390B|nr:beta-eliminating lyase-related protein [Terasakiella sp. A23]MDV7340095.1 beta-eliminating lyase-related protein [Terasakiella sp. A23]